MKRIGVYEAKTHLPRLLKEVAEGETFVITKHDTPVAILGPVDGPVRRSNAEVLESMMRTRALIKNKTTIEEIVGWIREDRDR